MMINKVQANVIPGLRDDLIHLGLEVGDRVIVHSSFKSLALTEYSPSDVIRTLQEVVGKNGTLIMPTHTYSYSGIMGIEPFDKEASSASLVGILPETFRQYPGVLRSGHPTHSVAALGKFAEQITNGKDMASAAGKDSSYDEAYLLGAKILLLGVGNDKNTMIHYAEAVAGVPYNDIPFRQFWGRQALIMHEGGAIEVPLVGEFPACSANFGACTPHLEEQSLVHRGKVCGAEAVLMNAVDIVEAVVKRLQKEPGWLLCNDIACEPCNLGKRRLANL